MASRLLPLAALFACACGTTISLPRDDTTTPKGVLSYSVFHEDSKVPLSKLKRQTDTDVPILNVTSTSYLIELMIGTPGQDTKVAIDTGSSELWVNPNCQKAGSASQTQQCQRNGQYNPSLSSSAQVSEQVGRVRYGKGEVAIQYVSDTIKLPGSDVNMQNVIFGAATDSVDLNMGILGLSFGLNYNLKYPNFIDALFLQNITASRAFGVALGTKAEPSNSGVISFGGVDTKKFSGKLHTQPILPRQNNENLYRYWVQMDSIGVTRDGSSRTLSGSSMPVFFDTGATLSYFPSAIVSQLASQLGGYKDSSSGFFIVKCGQTGSVDFTFGGFTVNVALQEFIWEVGQNTCIIGADAASDQSFILGDSFLRSVYTVFDIDTPALYFAKYTNCGTNLKAIPAGKNAAANFNGECTVDSSSSTKPNAAGRVSSPIGAAWLAAGSLLLAQLAVNLL